MGEHIELTARDGVKIGAYLARPTGAPKGGIVVIQEIFGVNHHIRATADLYASHGYVAVAPAIYDRVQKNYETGYEQADVQAGAAQRAAAAAAAGGMGFDRTLASSPQGAAKPQTAGKQLFGQ